MVKLGEGKLTSNKLEVIIEKKVSGAAEGEDNGIPFDFKRVFFTGGINLEHANRSARADKAELYPLQKQCKLIGNVKFEQKKEGPADIPIVSTCDEAVVDFETK